MMQIIAAITAILLAVTSGVAMAENRLAKSKSPYLQLHKDNPIDWHEWSDETLKIAQESGKPLFISIGYFSCHWCHVMNDEVFSDEEVGKMLNDNFICIKIDRQEMPGIDAFYMTFLQISGASTGWPMTIFATPSGAPFFGGTFFPARESRAGVTPLLTLAPALAKFYAERGDELVKNSANVLGAYKRLNDLQSDKSRSSELTFAKGYKYIEDAFDPERGGFAIKPKFPMAPLLFFLHEYEKGKGLPMVLSTIDQMANGAIHDHIGGGFHRYTVDENWHIPHFEKTLYDNALLARLYSMMERVTGDKKYGRVSDDTIEYVENVLGNDEGAWWAAQNADSPEGEGVYHSWTVDQINESINSKDAKLVAAYFGVEPIGTFTAESTIPYIPADINGFASDHKIKTGELKKIIVHAKSVLAKTRSLRPAPLVEKQVTADWTAMMARALIDRYISTQDESFLRKAKKALEFITTKMRRDNSIRHSWIDKRTGASRYIDDYAETIAAYIDLFEVTQSSEYLKASTSLLDEAITLFGSEDGGFYLTSNDFSKNENFIRQKSNLDNATPAGAPVIALSAQRLYLLTGDKRFDKIAHEIVDSGAGAMAMSPISAATWMRAAYRLEFGMTELVLAGDISSTETKEALGFLLSAPIFPKVVLLVDYGEKTEKIPAVHKDKIIIDGKPTLYLCKNFSCDLPLSGINEIKRMVQSNKLVTQKK